jgi:hypothetical protein
MDNHANLVLLSTQVECKVSFDKFMSGCFVCLAVFKQGEKTCICGVNMLSYDAVKPIEDAGVIIGLRE